MSGKHLTVIESLGVYLPPKQVSSHEILHACRNVLRYPLERLTGIRSRRMAGDVEFAIDLARKAVAECLKRSRHTAEDVDLLICCNISRYDGPGFRFSFEPSTAVRLRAHFGMRHAVCFDISNACAGMFTGAYIADAFLQAGLANRVLIVSGEYITHLTKTAQFEITDEHDERLACLTLGDSGVAVMLERASQPNVGFHHIEMYTLGAYSDCCVAQPTTSEAGGAIMVTDSLRIHAVAIRESVRQVAAVLKKVKWAPRDLKHFVMHQTARGAIAELARQFNEFIREQILDYGKMVNNLKDRGNTSSTSHFLAIWDNILANRIHRGEKVFFAVQASGITLGAAPYTFDDLPDRLREFEQRGTKPANIEVLEPAAGPAGGAAPPRRRVRIESLGVVPAAQTAVVPHTAVALASCAAEDCFAHSQCRREDIDVLIHAGVYRDGFISEPALAALIAGQLRINHAVATETQHKTFAYDVLNGAIGFLNACHNGAAMIHSGRARKVLVVTAEIDNNAHLGHRDPLGLKETGAAVILEASTPDDDSGFLAFHFAYFTQHLDRYYSHASQERGQTYLTVVGDPQLTDHYLTCIPLAVDEFLAREHVDRRDLKLVFPPQISRAFVTRFGQALALPPDRVVGVANGKDYFTASMVCALREARDRGRVGRGDLGLIVGVGTGIQVGCALYRF